MITPPWPKDWPTIPETDHLGDDTENQGGRPADLHKRKKHGRVKRGKRSRSQAPRMPRPSSSAPGPQGPFMPNPRA